MASSGEVIIERNGKQYGATYTLSNGMMHLKTHTETRSLDLGDEDADTLARRALAEIVDSQPTRR